MPIPSIFFYLSLIFLASFVYAENSHKIRHNALLGDSSQIGDEINFIKIDEIPGSQFSRRNLTTCASLTNCTSCNAVDTCIWSSGICSNNPLGTKTLEDYKICQTEDLSNTYCNLYFGHQFYALSKKKEGLKHIPNSSGTISPGVICEWHYNINPYGTVSFNVEWTKEEDQEIFIEVIHKNGEINNLRNNNITDLKKRFETPTTEYVTIYAIQKLSDSSSSYSVSLEINEQQETQVLLIVVSIVACSILVVGAIIFFRFADLYMKKRNRRLEALREKTLHDKRMKTILDENPPIPYDKILVKYEQTSCVICLEDFESSLDKKVRILPQCTHIFHSECINEWFKNSKDIDCPHCHKHLLTKKEILKESKKNPRSPHKNPSIHPLPINPSPENLNPIKNSPNEDEEEEEKSGSVQGNFKRKKEIERLQSFLTAPSIGSGNMSKVEMLKGFQQPLGIEEEDE